MGKKKYRKRGQIDIYEPVKNDTDFGAIIGWLIAIVIGLAVLSQCAG